MTKELTKKEIYERMKESRNIKKLHKASIETNKQQKEVIKNQSKIIKNQEEEINLLKQQVQTLKLQVEELQRIVFGKSKKDKNNNSEDNLKKSKNKEKVKRNKNSYKREVPKEDEITGRKECRIYNCPDCSTILVKKEIKTFYVEDIVLPNKTITENKVERGFCRKCKKYHSKIPIPNAKVIIGENVKNQIAYQTTILRLSYEQIRDDLKNSFNFRISSGEIDKVLRRKGEYHSVDYERLKEMIRKEKVIHFDETGDKVRDGDGFRSYTWLMQGKDKPEVVFDKGQTRGGGNAVKLLQNSPAVGVTDDYGVYKNIFQNHQLCWAHLHRKFRDLSESGSLEEKAKIVCQKTFQKESKIYSSIRELANRNDLTEKEREVHTTKFTEQLQNLSKPTRYDPKKLLTYRKTLSKNIYKYLTCIRLPNIPADNNQAERSLRHIVLKRKNSFGHISSRGAETSSILMSVFLTIRNRIKDTNQTFFEAYAEFVV